MPNQNDILLNNGTNWILTGIEDFSTVLNSTLSLADSGTQGLLSASDFGKLQNISNINSGDETTSSILTKIGNGTVIDSSYLPSYVDDVLEFNSLSSFPITGEANKIYIDLSDNKQYRWSGSSYIQITNGYISSTDDIPDSLNKRYQTDNQQLFNDVTSSIQTQLNNKQSQLNGDGIVISNGTNGVSYEDTSYYLDTTNHIEGSKLFHTNQRVLDSVLTGLSATSGSVLETDSVLTAISKLKSSSSSIISLTVSDFQLLNGVYSPSTTYKISNADTNLYGGTEIYLTTNGEGLLNERGLGKFYNPKYDQNVAGFNVWTNLSEWIVTPTSGTWTPQYPPENITGQNGATGKLFTTINGNKFIPLTGDWSAVTTISGDVTGASATLNTFIPNSYLTGTKVHWGGKTWSRNSDSVNGLVGTAIDIYTLDNTWTLIPFDDIDYNVVYDEIKYDSLNDIIVYRNEHNSNIVSISKSFIDNSGGWWNSIKDFMWGNVYDIDSKGIGSQNIIESYNENLNFRGEVQIYVNFTNYSYQYSTVFENYSRQSFLVFINYSGQSDLIYDNNSYQVNLTFDKNSNQQYLIFDNNSFQTNLTFNTNSVQTNLTFLNSVQQHLNFDGQSYQDGLVFSNGSSQTMFRFYNSYQQTLTFDNASYQVELIFDQFSNQSFLTETTGNFQSRITFHDYQFNRTSSPLLTNESNLEFKGDLPTITSLNTTTDKIYVKQNNQVKEITTSDLGIIRRTKTITSSSLVVPYIPLTDSIYILTGSNTITLPSAVDNENVYRVIRSSIQSVYVASVNDELFNDANGQITLNINRMQIEFISDGQNWIY